jgi:hypothetical protein
MCERNGDSTIKETATEGEGEGEEGSTVTTGGGVRTVVCTTVVVPGSRTLEVTFGGAGEGYIESQTRMQKRKHWFAKANT